MTKLEFKQLIKEAILELVRDGVLTESLLAKRTITSKPKSSSRQVKAIVKPDFRKHIKAASKEELYEGIAGVETEEVVETPDEAFSSEGIGPPIVSKGLKPKIIESVVGGKKYTSGVGVLDWFAKDREEGFELESSKKAAAAEKMIEKLIGR